ncbi:50S ribosomal protein L9 [soil metagenome]
MDVILLERVNKLGAMGEIVKVKNGYARNFLLPEGKALRATDANKAKYEREKTVLEAKSADQRQAAQANSSQISGKGFVILRQAGESGQLYGSVSTRDIAEAVSTGGATVERKHVLLESPIKTIGLYTIQIALHPEVLVPITLNVARSQDEADAQTRGEVLTGPVSDRAEARQAAEELFEAEGVGSDEGEDEV